jgi:plastocyanin
MPRSRPVVALIGYALLLAGCGGSSTHASQPAPKPVPVARSVTVVMRDFKYHPARLTVKAGTGVRWRNADSSPHTATAKGLNTRTVSEGRSATLTLTRPGRYAYACVFHPFMHGTVVVTSR